MSRSRPGILPLTESLRALRSRADSLILHKLRFPNYRNIEANQVLEFTFPITALLGCNGTNKSSILHALYGSLKGNSIADFWFETKLDAIPETRDGLKQSVTHTYRNRRGHLVECIKARAPRGAADPDYWEAVKPTAPYGFSTNQKRVPPVNAKVVHLDFRALLPAFDKYFYYPDRNHLAGLIRRAKTAGRLRREYRKQDYLRRKSGHVKRELAERGVDLSEDALSALAFILGRTYRAGRIVEHASYHGHHGRTIRFSIDNIAGGYTDAFAGSGESAAAFLVHDILCAPQNSLILLDEPETSLHPKAQQRALEFICDQAVKHQHQVVLSTHSTYFAEDLPSAAVRVLVVNAAGRIDISAEHSAREALHEVADLPAGRVVIVEDERAKHLMLSALKAWGKGAARDVRVVVRSGGASRIFADIHAHAIAGRNDLFVVLDGDHRPESQLPNPDELPQGKVALERIVRDYTKGPGTAGPRLGFDDASDVTRYIEFIRRRLRFLPGRTPEALVWSEPALRSKVGSVPDTARKAADYKQRLRIFADAHPGMDADTVFKILVSELIRADSNEAKELKAITDEIRQST